MKVPAGFEVRQTGGGCTAWTKVLQDGHTIMVTNEDGYAPPDSDHWFVGIYDEEGQEVEYGGRDLIDKWENENA